MPASPPPTLWNSSLFLAKTRNSSGLWVSPLFFFRSHLLTRLQNSWYLQFCQLFNYPKSIFALKNRIGFYLIQAYKHYYTVHTMHVMYHPNESRRII